VSRKGVGGDRRECGAQFNVQIPNPNEIPRSNNQIPMKKWPTPPITNERSLSLNRRMLGFFELHA
jgi:hypothetical protein